MQQAVNLNKIITYFLLLIALLLLGLVCTSPHHIIYDEFFFVPNIALLGKYGLSAKFLNSIFGQSPGPLYQFIYYPLKYIGITTINQYRLVNLLLLYGSTYFMYLLFKMEHTEFPVWKSLLIFAIPLTWCTGGLALTEVPTICFALASLVILRSVLLKSANQYLLLCLSGLLLGFSVLGRTPFLMLIPAACILFILTTSINLPAKLIYLSFAAVMPAIVFACWHGLVPPDVQGIQSGISFLYLAFSFSYSGVFLLIIYPQWFKIPRFYYVLLAVLSIVFFVVNCTIFKVSYLPIHTLNKLLPQTVLKFYEYYFSYFFPCLMVCLALLYLIALGYRLLQSKSDSWQIFLLVAGALIILTTIKSSAQFSARYPFQAFPFLLLYCGKYIKANWGLLIRAGIGIALGLVSLMGYYKQ